MLNTEVSTIAASISSVQTKELENGNHQISRGKFDQSSIAPISASGSILRAPNGNPTITAIAMPSFQVIGRSPQRQISSHLIRIFMLQPRNNGRHLLALSELSDQLDTTGYHTGSLIKEIRLSAEVVLRIFKGVNAF